jgi:hypothetical protein
VLWANTSTASSSNSSRNGSSSSSSSSMAMSVRLNRIAPPGSVHTTSVKPVAAAGAHETHASKVHRKSRLGYRSVAEMLVHRQVQNKRMMKEERQEEHERLRQRERDSAVASNLLGGVPSEMVRPVVVVTKRATGDNCLHTEGSGAREGEVTAICQTEVLVVIVRCKVLHLLLPSFARHKIASAVAQRSRWLREREKDYAVNIAAMRGMMHDMLGGVVKQEEEQKAKAKGGMKDRSNRFDTGSRSTHTPRLEGGMIYAVATGGTSVVLPPAGAPYIRKRSQDARATHTGVEQGAATGTDTATITANTAKTSSISTTRVQSESQHGTNSTPSRSTQQANLSTVQAQCLSVVGLTQRQAKPTPSEKWVAEELDVSKNRRREQQREQQRSLLQWDQAIEAIPIAAIAAIPSSTVAAVLKPPSASPPSTRGKGSTLARAAACTEGGVKASMLPSSKGSATRRPTMAGGFGKKALATGPIAHDHTSPMASPNAMMARGPPISLSKAPPFSIASDGAPSVQAEGGTMAGGVKDFQANGSDAPKERPPEAHTMQGKRSGPTIGPPAMPGQLTIASCSPLVLELGDPLESNGVNLQCPLESLSSRDLTPTSPLSLRTLGAVTPIFPAPMPPTRQSKVAMLPMRPDSARLRSRKLIHRASLPAGISASDGAAVAISAGNGASSGRTNGTGSSVAQGGLKKVLDQALQQNNAQIASSESILIQQQPDNLQQLPLRPSNRTSLAQRGLGPTNVAGHTYIDYHFDSDRTRKQATRGAKAMKRRMQRDRLDALVLENLVAPPPSSTSHQPPRQLHQPTTQIAGRLDQWSHVRTSGLMYTAVSLLGSLEGRC